MSKHFNSKERFEKKIARQRVYDKERRAAERAKVLKSIEAERDRLSACSKLAEQLAALVTYKPIVAKTTNEKFRFTPDMEKKINNISNTLHNISPFQQEIIDRNKLIGSLMETYEEKKPLPKIDEKQSFLNDLMKRFEELKNGGD